MKLPSARFASVALLALAAFTPFAAADQPLGKLNVKSFAVTPVQRDLAALRLTGTAEQLRNCAAYAELVSDPDAGGRTPGGQGVIAFRAANGDLLVGVVAWQYDLADHSLALEVHWRDAVTFSDGTTVASTGRFVERRPPGIIAILIGWSACGSVFLEGDLRPGASPALVHFGGALNFGAGARLVEELGGTALGSQYDSVDVFGKVDLAGVIDVDLLNGFQPAAGEQFTVLTFGSRSGDFTTYRDLDLGNGLALVPSFSDHSLVLTVSSVPEPSALALGGLAAAGWVALRPVGRKPGRSA